MSLTIEAIYENGMLRLAQPLPFKEQEKLLITIEPALTCAERTAGMMGWTGSEKDAEFFAMSPELESANGEEL
jgi:predicted DNA-binding antitoxin AbrB/MazE fold protein